MYETHLIKFLNINGARTSIEYSDFTKKFYVSTRAEIKSGAFLKGVSEHRDTIEQAIKAFNDAVKGNCVVIDAYKESHREIFIPNFM